MVGGRAGLMRIERAWVSDCPAVSATRSVNADVPVAVGVPEMVPVEGLRIRFCGKSPSASVHSSAPVPPLA